jgi:enamine deaminase RidA (YjgF/YER057c/UK114 family)
MSIISKRRSLILASSVLSIAAAASAFAAEAQKVVRLPLAGSDFPIAAAVTVKAGVDTYFLSGALGPTVNKDAPKGSPPTFGDTQTQTVAALTSIKGTLARLGLTMGDVIKMTVFLVGDPSKDNKMDFAGMMAGYKQFFGSADQPNLPTRSAVQVAALAAPGALVEIEVTAAKSH